MARKYNTTLIVDGFEDQTLVLTTSEAMLFARGVFTMATTHWERDTRLLAIEEALEDFRRGDCGEIQNIRVVRDQQRMDMTKGEPKMKRSFQEWMRIVNYTIRKRTDGLEALDLDDYCYLDEYNNGTSPYAAAGRAISATKEY